MRVACGGRFTEGQAISGEISSPPASAAGPMHCEWVVRASAPSRLILLNFKRFQLDGILSSLLFHCFLLYMRSFRLQKYFLITVSSEHFVRPAGCANAVMRIYEGNEQIPSVEACGSDIQLRLSRKSSIRITYRLTIGFDVHLHAPRAALKYIYFS